MAAASVVKTGIRRVSSIVETCSVPSRAVTTNYVVPSFELVVKPFSKQSMTPHDSVNLTHDLPLNVPWRCKQENHDYKALPGRNIASELSCAKPVTWKGVGELPQLPWSAHTNQLFLLIDMWSGTGGAAIALLALGVRFVALMVEDNVDCIMCQSRVSAGCAY